MSVQGRQIHVQQNKDVRITMDPIPVDVLLAVVLGIP